MSTRSYVYILIAAAVIVIAALAMHRAGGGGLRGLAQTIHGHT